MNNRLMKMNAYVYLIGKWDFNIIMKILLKKLNVMLTIIKLISIFVVEVAKSKYSMITNNI